MFPRITTSSPDQILTFTAPQTTLTMNPDPSITSLPDTEVTKLLHLKSMAKNIPDGFASSLRIIRNPLLGTSNILPQKRPASTLQTSKKSPKPRVMYTSGSTESDPNSLAEAQSRSDQHEWQTALEAKYALLCKHKVFGSTTIKLTKPPISHKLIFTRKVDAQGNVIKYKIRLVAQGFSQRP